MPSGAPSSVPWQTAARPAASRPTGPRPTSYNGGAAAAPRTWPVTAVPLVVRPSGGPTPGGQSSVNTRQSDQRYDNEQAFELRGWLKGLDDGAGAMVQYFDVLAFDDLSQNGYGPILKTNWKHSGRNH